MTETEFPETSQPAEPQLAGGASIYQTTSEVYRTKPACTTVKMSPGTRPRTEYEYGKDMMARQMYSEKSRAAV